MTHFDSELRSGPWTWRPSRPTSPGRFGFADVQLWHDERPLPLLDVSGGAWVLAAPEFAADGTDLQCDVVALANRARFRVTFELAAGRWRSAGEPRGQPVAVFQQRFGTGSAIAPWPVVSIVPQVSAPPAENDEEHAAASANEVRAGGDEAAAEAPQGEAGQTDGAMPAEEPAPGEAVTPAIERASARVEVPPGPSADEVLPPPAVTPDGRWRFQFAWAPVHERDAAGRLRSYCHFVLHDTRAAVAFDSRDTGDLCWPAGRWLRLVRGPEAPVWFLVDVERAVFWLENFREPLGPERSLDELAATLARR